MKSIFVILVFLLTSFQVKAVTVDVTGKNGESLFHGDNSEALPSSAGEISIHTFDANKIAYEGSAAGVTKIFDIGPDTEIISATEIKAYGWCFSVNGEVSTTMPDQNSIRDPNARILWYYCFAHYKDGQWTN